MRLIQFSLVIALAIAPNAAIFATPARVPPHPRIEIRPHIEYREDVKGISSAERPKTQHDSQDNTLHRIDGTSEINCYTNRIICDRFEQFRNNYEKLTVIIGYDDARSSAVVLANVPDSSESPLLFEIQRTRTSYRDIAAAIASFDSKLEPSILADKLRQDHGIAVGANAFTSEGALRVPFDEGDVPIYFLDDKGNRTHLDRLDVNPPPPVFIGKVSDGCCLRGRPPGSLSDIRDGIKNATFSKKDIYVLSLVENRRLDSTLQGSELGANKVEFPLSEAESDSAFEERLRSVLAAKSGATLIVIGHVDASGLYVNEDLRGETRSKISLARLRELAKSYNVQLIDVGCKTGAVPSSGARSVGVVETISATDAGQRVTIAYNEASSMTEFLERLSGPEFNIVVDKDAFRDFAMSAGIYTGLKRHPVGAYRAGEIGLVRHAWSPLHSLLYALMHPFHRT